MRLVLRGQLGINILLKRKKKPAIITAIIVVYAINICEFYNQDYYKVCLVEMLPYQRV